MASDGGLGTTRRAAEWDWLETPDPEFCTALGRMVLPGIVAIARELESSSRARGERRGRDHPNPATCDVHR